MMREAKQEARDETPAWFAQGCRGVPLLAIFLKKCNINPMKKRFLPVIPNYF